VEFESLYAGTGDLDLPLLMKEGTT
jgi:hypothetical protein